MKNFKPIYLVALALIVFGLYQLGFIGRGVEYFDGYMFYDDFALGSFDETRWDIGTGTAPTVSTSGIMCSLHTEGGEPITDTCGFSTDKSFDNEDIKIFYQYSMSKGNLGSSASVSLSFNGRSIPLGAVGTTLSAEGSGIIEIIHSALTPSSYIVLHNGQQIVSGTISEGNAKIFANAQAFNSGGTFANSMIRISAVKEKIPFGCEVSDTEVMVFDDFASDSIIQLKPISTFYYVPLRFCFDNPTIIRTTTTEGGLRQDRLAEVFNILSQGESVTVPTNRVYRVPYITKYVDDMELRCAIGEAYNTRTRTCQQIVDQEPLNLACTQASDCWAPTNCPGISISCVSNKCQYSSNTCDMTVVMNELLTYQEKNRKLMNESNVIILATQENEFIWVQSGTGDQVSGQNPKIGNLQLSATPPVFTCISQANNESIGVGRPSGGCWYTDFSMGSFSTRMTSGASANANVYTQIQYTASGEALSPPSYSFEDEPNKDWQNTFLFKLTNDFVRVQTYNAAVSDTVPIDKPAQLPFILINNYAEFTNNSAGVMISCDSDLIDFDSSVMIVPLELKMGTNEYIVNFYNNRLGMTTCEIQPYVKINVEKPTTILMNNKLAYRYEVVDKNPEYIYVDNPVVVGDGEKEDEPDITDPKKDYTIYIIIGLVAAAAFAMYKWKRR